MYKVKKNNDGLLEKYKAHLVAKGYVQKLGIYFNEIFSSITKLTSITVLLALLVAQDLEFVSGI